MSPARRDPALAFRDTDPEIELPDGFPTEPPPAVRPIHDTLPSVRVPLIAEIADGGTEADASTLELRIRVQPDGSAADHSGDVLEAVLQSLRHHGWKPTFVAMGPLRSGPVKR